MFSGVLGNFAWPKCYPLGKLSLMDSNWAEDFPPLRSSTRRDPQLRRNNSAAEGKKGRTMNPRTHSKNSTILSIFIALALSAIAASASHNLPFRLGDEG